MKKKVLNIFTVLMSLFAFIFILASCGSKSDDNNGGNNGGNNSNQDTPKAYTREGNKIYFGSYPQTKVEASTDNGLSSIEFDASIWTSYKYNRRGSQTDFMYYKDVDTNNDGTYDYRGVYFTHYRPATSMDESSTDTSYQDDNGYSKETIYWFKYEAIEWNILKEANGKALINTNLLLDSQEYYLTTLDHNGGNGYANNYELSNIRIFLNDKFYNTAFNDAEKAAIETTTVDNSAASTGNSTNAYACDDTEDKMFLLSRQEIFDTYDSNDDLSCIAQGTDYAKCQGLYNVYSWWWLRSPYNGNADQAYYLNDSNLRKYYVNDTRFGVRPACYIKL